MPDCLVWTTISCLQNPGPGAYAIRIDQEGKAPLQAAFGRRHTTTNRMQLFAVIAALTHIRRLHPGENLDITLRSSSRYVTDNLHKTWHKSQEGETNADLSELLDDAMDDHRIEAKWVKTGSAQELVELQQQAGVACGERALPADTGYERGEGSPGQIQTGEAVGQRSPDGRQISHAPTSAYKPLTTHR